MIDIVRALRPIGCHGKWSRDPHWQPHEGYPRGYPIERWIEEKNDISVLSAVEVVAEKDNKEKYREPEYHLSMAKMLFLPYLPRVGRLDTNAAKWVLCEFGLEYATEDNHVPHGMVRNFWRPVAGHLVGRPCPCIFTEVEIRENKGDYVWRPA